MIIPISSPDYREGKFVDHGSTIDITFEYRLQDSSEVLTKEFTIVRDSLDETVNSLFHKYNTLVQEFRNDNLVG